MRFKAVLVATGSFRTKDGTELPRSTWNIADDYPNWYKSQSMHVAPRVTVEVKYDSNLCLPVNVSSQAIAERIAETLNNEWSHFLHEPW